MHSQFSSELWFLGELFLFLLTNFISLNLGNQVKSINDMVSRHAEFTGIDIPPNCIWLCIIQWGDVWLFHKPLLDHSSEWLRAYSKLMRINLHWKGVNGSYSFGLIPREMLERCNLWCSFLADCLDCSCSAHCRVTGLVYCLEWTASCRKVAWAVSQALLIYVTSIQHGFQTGFWMSRFPLEQLDILEKCLMNGKKERDRIKSQ